MHTATGRLLLRSAVAAALVLGTAGCSSGSAEQAGQVKTSAPVVSSSTPTPTPTPVEQQVEAAVRAYYAELTRAIRTGDTSVLRHLSTKSCPCYGSVTSIDQANAKRQAAPDAGIDVLKVKVHDVIAQSAGAEISYDVSAYDLVEQDGEVVSHVRGRTDHVDLSMIHKSDAWVVSNVFNLGRR